MKYGDFRTQLKSFIQRKDIQDAQVDFFANAGLSEIQLERDFNFTRKTASLVYPSSVGVGIALPSDFKALTGQRSVSVGINGINRPLEGESFNQRQRRQSQTTPLPAITAAEIPIPCTGVYYRVEWLSEVPTLFLYPETAGAQLQLWYYSFIADYGTDDSREDFLLKRGSQVLLYSALKCQNRYVKEEYRIPVDDSMYQECLMRLLEYDARIPDNGASMSLS